MQDVFGIFLSFAGTTVFLFLGATLLLAAISKLRDQDEFFRVLHSYDLLPERLVDPAKTVIPIIELALGIALVIPPAAQFAAIPAAVLLLVFAAAMGINLLRGRTDLDCGCGTGGTVSWQLVARRLATAAAVLLAMQVSAANAMTYFSSFILVFGGICLKWIFQSIGSMSSPSHLIDRKTSS